MTIIHLEVLPKCLNNLCDYYALFFQAPGSYLVSVPPGMKSPLRMLDPDVLAVEQENQRLEDEIFRIQLAREKNKREHGITVSLRSDILRLDDKVMFDI